MRRKTRRSTIDEHRYVRRTLGTIADLRTQVRAADPVHSQKLADVISANLAATQGMNGGAEAFHAQWLSSVEPLVLEELMKRLSGQLKG
jgi:hypothetical protein